MGPKPVEDRATVPGNVAEDTTVVHPWNAACFFSFFLRHRLDGLPLIVSPFVAHDSKLRGSAARLNILYRGAS